MNKKGIYAFSIHEVFNYIRKIFTKETFLKYCIIHSFIKSAKVVIKINAEKTKTAVLFKYDYSEVSYSIAYREIIA